MNGHAWQTDPYQRTARRRPRHVVALNRLLPPATNNGSWIGTGDMECPTVRLPFPHAAVSGGCVAGRLGAIRRDEADEDDRLRQPNNSDSLQPRQPAA
jgi:hypothetical protein